MVLDLEDRVKSGPEVFLFILIVQELFPNLWQVNETPDRYSEVFNTFSFSFPHVVEEESAELAVVGFFAEEPQELSVELKGSRSLP